jgi:hypothetical protein
MISIIKIQHLKTQFLCTIIVCAVTSVVSLTSANAYQSGLAIALPPQVCVGANFSRVPTFVQDASTKSFTQWPGRIEVIQLANSKLSHSHRKTFSLHGCTRVLGPRPLSLVFYLKRCLWCSSVRCSLVLRDLIRRCSALGT